MNRHLSCTRIAIPLLMGLAACAASTLEPEPSATIDDPLYGLGGNADPWPNGEVPVCFQSPTEHTDLQTAVRLILADSWAKHAHLHFVGFRGCPRRRSLFIQTHN